MLGIRCKISVGPKIGPTENGILPHSLKFNHHIKIWAILVLLFAGLFSLSACDNFNGAELPSHFASLSQFDPFDESTYVF